VERGLGQCMDLAMDVVLFTCCVHRDFTAAWKHTMTVTMKSDFVCRMSLTPMKLRGSSFWNVAPCLWVTGTRRFWDSVIAFDRRHLMTCRHMQEISSGPLRTPTNSDLSVYLNNLRYYINIYSSFAIWLLYILELQHRIWPLCIPHVIDKFKKKMKSSW